MSVLHVRYFYNTYHFYFVIDELIDICISYGRYYLEFRQLHRSKNDCSLFVLFTQLFKALTSCYWLNVPHVAYINEFPSIFKIIMLAARIANFKTEKDNSIYFITYVSVHVHCFYNSCHISFVNDELIAICISYGRYYLEFPQSQHCKIGCSQFVDFAQLFKTLTSYYFLTVPHFAFINEFHSVFKVAILAAE